MIKLKPVLKAKLMAGNMVKAKHRGSISLQIQ